MKTLIITKHNELIRDFVGSSIVIHKGASLTLINPEIAYCKLRGIQCDAGHLGLLIRGGHIHDCGNDGIGVDGGHVRIYGTTINRIGIDGQDSRDCIQLSGDGLNFAIVGCDLTSNYNSCIIVKPTAIGGLIKDNHCRGGQRHRHGIALEGSYSTHVAVMGNTIENHENGIYGYGAKPPGDFRSSMTINTFLRCEHSITEDWS